MPLSNLIRRFKEMTQRHYIKLVQSLPEDERRKYIEQQMQKLPEHEREQVRQIQLKAGAERALTRLQEAQKVDYLPQTYRHYMLEQGPARRKDGAITLMGSHKLGWILEGGLYEDFSGSGPSDWAPQDDYGNTTKGQFTMRLDGKLSYPQDAFVFFSDLWCKFFFFRTKLREDDPAIYSYEETNCFYKLADSFSEFLELCAQDASASQAAWGQRHQTAYYFDPESDGFYSAALVDLSSLPDALQQALRPRSASFQGCSDTEIEELRQAQHVDYLPDMYRRVMRVMGKWGLGQLLCGTADYSDSLKELQWVKDEFVEEERVFPPDIFIFFNYRNSSFNFFRTTNHDDDPPVYGDWGDGAFHKIADSFSEYLRYELFRADEEMIDRAPVIYGVNYHYDLEQDDFLPIPSPPDTRPLDDLLRLMQKRCGHDMAGCSEAEIGELQQAQDVTSLPHVYRQILLLMGKKGLDNVLYPGNVTYKHLQQNKQLFEAEIAPYKEKPAYPPDIFVFYRGHFDFYFFQTHDGNDDPPVYAMETGTTYKFAESLSQFILQELDRNTYRQTHRAWQRRFIEYVYDNELGAFHALPLPDDSPSYEKVAEVVASRWFADELQGCTETEIEELQNNQHVACLPTVYTRLMALMGHNGIQRAFDKGAVFARLQPIKENYAAQNLTQGVPFPEDAFVFCVGEQTGQFYFFRTKDCQNDPAVYECRKSHLYKAADSLSTFALQQLDQNHYRKNMRDELRFQAKVRYDAAQDEIVSRNESSNLEV